MKRETEIWLDFSRENLQSCKILLDSHLYNPSLQNAQQAIEKSLKALMIEHGIKMQRTHNIATLLSQLQQQKIAIGIEEDEVDLIDSIYLSSKYPLGSVLPDFHPDESLCRTCLHIAKTVLTDVEHHLDR